MLSFHKQSDDIIPVMISKNPLFDVDDDHVNTHQMNEIVTIHTNTINTENNNHPDLKFATRKLLAFSCSS